LIHIHPLHLSNHEPQHFISGYSFSSSLGEETVFGVGLIFSDERSGSIADAVHQFDYPKRVLSRQQ
jgi:hypothetical protein